MPPGPYYAGQAYKTPKREIKERHRKCGWTTCHRTAFLEDWTGSQWCFYHAYYCGRWNGGNKWFWFKNLKLRNPYLKD